MEIELIEDNAGHLFLWMEDRGYAGAEQQEPDGYLPTEAPSWWRAVVDAIRTGEDDEWSGVEEIHERPLGTTIAWDDGKERRANPRRASRLGRALIYGTRAPGNPASRCDGVTLQATDGSGHAGTCPGCGYSSQEAHEDARAYLRASPPVRVDSAFREPPFVLDDDGSAWALCRCGLRLDGGWAASGTEFF